MRYLLCVTLVIASCAAPQQALVRPAAGPCKACSEDAVVVFVRQSHMGPVTVEVREQDGTFLGRLEDETWLAVPVAAGRHLFIASVLDRTNTRPTGLYADLEAGKTYHVQVEVPRFYPAMFAAGPGRKGWAQLEVARSKLTRLEREPHGLESPPPPDFPRTVGYVKSWWSSLGTQDWEERTLVASDALAPDAALVERPEGGVTCAPVPLDLYAANPAPGTDQDVLQCWTEQPVGSHVPVKVCKSQREIDEMRKSTQDYLNKPRSTPTVDN